MLSKGPTRPGLSVFLFKAFLHFTHFALNTLGFFQVVPSFWALSSLGSCCFVLGHSLHHDRCSLYFRLQFKFTYQKASEASYFKLDLPSFILCNLYLSPFHSFFSDYIVMYWF